MDLRQLTHSEVRICDLCGDEELQKLVVTSWIDYPRDSNPVQYSNFSFECQGCNSNYTTPAQVRINKTLGIAARKAANSPYQSHDEYLD